MDIQEHLYIKILANKVVKLVSQCTLCQRAKPINARYDVEPQCTLRDKPRALVAVDCHGPLPASNFGNRHIFVLHDVFSKFVKLYPLKALSTRSCLSKIFDDYVPKYGPIEAILCDNATIFTSEKWSATLSANQVREYHCCVLRCGKPVRKE